MPSKLCPLSDLQGGGQIKRPKWAKSDDQTQMGKDATNCGAGNPERRFRYEAVSAPYRSASTLARGWTVSKIDELGRVVEVRQYAGPDLPIPWNGNSANTITGTRTTVYQADWVTGTDEAGRRKRSASDGYGRMVEVVEDPAVNPGDKGYLTSYEYDANDNLTKVSQAGTIMGNTRVRNFEYTSLGRLKRAQNPESGAIDYTYDNGGNVLTKADSRVSMSMGAYDALGRPTSKSYGAGTPPVSYIYDSCVGGKGRLCGVTTAGGGNDQTSVAMEYDLMGRLVKRTQSVGGISHIVTQSYLLNGLVREIVYPTSTVSLPRKVIYEYWPNGQMKEAWQGAVGTGLRYARYEDYQAGGTAQSVMLGNSVVENSQANERGQMVSRSWTKDAVNFHALSFGYGSQNNGNLRTQGISGLHLGVGFNFQQGFDYDSINRLRIFQDSGMSGCGSVAARQQYVFDRYGCAARA